jgi:hypothetical protein
MKVTSLLLCMLTLIFVSLIFQNLYGPTLSLKVVQVISACFGNLLLIYKFRTTKLNILDQIFLLVIIFSIFLGVINSKSITFLIYSIFPLINTISISLGLIIFVRGPVHLRKPEIHFRILLLIFLLTNILLIIFEFYISGKPFIYYRATGLLFKPSSSSILLAFTAIIVLFNKKLQAILLISLVVLFKSMAALALTFVNFVHHSKASEAQLSRGLLIFLVPILSLCLVYAVDLIYNRELWVSVGTRLSILMDFDFYGFGLGYGTNIIKNAAGMVSQVSDGTLSLLKLQFGILGYVWGAIIILYCLIITIKGNIFIGYGILISTLSVNIPEVAFLSLLIPMILFRAYKTCRPI